MVMIYSFFIVWWFFGGWCCTWLSGYLVRRVGFTPAPVEGVARPLVVGASIVPRTSARCPRTAVPDVSKGMLGLGVERGIHPDVSRTGFY